MFVLFGIQSRKTHPDATFGYRECPHSISVPLNTNIACVGADHDGDTPGKYRTRVQSQGQV